MTETLAEYKKNIDPIIRALESYITTFSSDDKDYGPVGMDLATWLKRATAHRMQEQQTQHIISILNEGADIMDKLRLLVNEGHRELAADSFDWIEQVEALISELE